MDKTETKYSRMDSKKVALQLFQDLFPIERYEELQRHRKERLNLWLDRHIQVLAEKEMELISDGEKVLQELKILYSK